MTSNTGTSAQDAKLAWLRALERTAPITRSPLRTFPVVIAELAERYREAPALLSNAATFSFQDLDERANQYARWALAEGIRLGDVVCLSMPNCPEYLAAWVGITRAGGTVALLNTQIVGHALAHAIGIVAPRAVIAAGPALAQAMRAIKPKLAGDIRCWSDHDAGAGFDRLNLALAAQSTAPPQCAPPTLAHKALHIYTSGTTGLPKAANISHQRVMQWSHWFAGLMDTRHEDRMQNVLPMYHAIGGIVATGAVLVGGGSVRIAETFSVSRFWDEVVDNDCTVFQYIGELCRYLVNAPPHPRERAHQLRLAVGNGLALPVWQHFQNRFQLPHILEYYAATEGTFSLYNCEGRPGAIGRIPPFLRPRMSVELIRHDVDAGMPARGEDGLCIRCAPGETGEAVGRLDSGAAGAGAARFEGYTDAAASGEKVLRDVATPGDAWFRTGDLMRRDGDGFYYFVDRIGETYRWKGENVSATEVAATLAQCAGVKEAIVYGVRVAGTEGRAGMAALVVDDGFDVSALWRHAAVTLPAFAQPVFVRLLTGIDTTATFKPRKIDYVRDGFDPAIIMDPLYVADDKAGAFIPLDAAVHAQMLSGARPV